MTEEEWLDDTLFTLWVSRGFFCHTDDRACGRVLHMMECLRGRATQRQWRIFGLHCCHQNVELFTDIRILRAIELGERLVDGVVDQESLTVAQNAVYDAFVELEVGDFDGYLSAPAQLLSPRYSIDEAMSLSSLAHDVEYRDGSFDGVVNEMYREQAEFLRELFGNPFRPISFDPRWRTPTAVGVAQKMYDSREFSAMPILADALQDAGCEDEAILSHCRDAGQLHVRGCWVCDLVLGKA